MGLYTIRMPDIGEGIAEAEIAEWLVGMGDIVQEDQPLCAVMTDKATVEIPSPVGGTVQWRAADVGEILAVGAAMIRLEVAGEGNSAADVSVQAPTAARPAVAEAPAKAAPPAAATRPAPEDPTPKAVPVSGDPVSAPLRAEGERPIAPPSVRVRARAAGVDLRQVRGSGPMGRITHDDLAQFIALGGQVVAPNGPKPDTTVEDIRIIGMRRKISQKMTAANAIPHITIVEEVDVSALEELRAKLNADNTGTKLTMLPFVALAIVRAVRHQPHLNAHHLPDEELSRRFDAVNIGVATQTPKGLMVPVIHHAEGRTLRDMATEIARLAEAARTGSALREDLTGSTITITSLGVLGAIATTPILNAPEVAIVGVNRMAVRPHWNGTAFEPRRMMNLSCSFDHRVIDGWDAAVFVNKLKTLLEAPAMIFVES
jgi:2-oxoisovalerate dehydrogenase E2 component (dihydrolipoyl transacylase)